MDQKYFENKLEEIKINEATVKMKLSNINTTKSPGSLHAMQTLDFIISIPINNRARDYT